MAGYKKTVIEDDAAAFWTFDGDRYDPVTRKIIILPEDPFPAEVIIDEIDLLNLALIHSDDEINLGYRLGMPSLVKLEQTDNAACSFGYYGKLNDHPQKYPKAFLEVPHSLSFAFPNLGSFSVEFLMAKYPESNYTSDYPTHSRKSPIIRKANLFEIYIDQPYSNTDNLKTIFFPVSSSSIHDVNYDSHLGVSLYSKPIHYFLSWNVTEVNNGQYNGNLSIYINGRQTFSQNYTKFDTPWLTNVATPIEIAGLINSNDIKVDRNRGRLDLDQIAIYSRGLSADEVLNHYKKIYPYEDMVVADFAKNYWTLGDSESTIDFTISPYVGSIDGVYVGTNQQIIREMPGPKNIANSASVLFDNGGHAHFKTLGTQSQYTAFSSLNTDYTFEFWISSTENRRAVLLSIQELTYPYEGPLVQLNVRNHQYAAGAIQFSDKDTGTVCTSNNFNDYNDPIFYNNGQFGLVHVLKRADQLELWINGKLQSSTRSPVFSVGQPGQFVMLNSIPGNLWAKAYISNVAYYAYALQGQQIRARWNYNLTYRIKGIVTLMGVAYQATLRFFKSKTGELLKEINSDPNTGEYEIELYDNSNIDILVFSSTDRSVRYRAYGPITPSEYQDLPISL